MSKVGNTARDWDMTKAFQSHLDVLEDPQGLKISRTDDDRHFLVVTFRKKAWREKLFAAGFWMAVGALLGMAAFMVWWVWRSYWLLLAHAR
jgi:hypothetical protein